jgi:hypothetical protein
MTKKAIWISYDFGLKGDYTGLYTWLDNMKAIECGNSLAFMNLELNNSTFNSHSSNKDILTYIKNSMKDYVKLTKTDRIYVIWKDNENNLVKGEFINGNRKQSPWEGYGKLEKEDKTDFGE